MAAGHGDYMALAAAAAIAFREAHYAGGAASAEDLADALNIAASALSRLVTIYAFDAPSDSHVPVVLDLTKGRFVDGAALFRPHALDGSAIGSLAVRHDDLASALSLIRRTGLPYWNQRASA